MTTWNVVAVATGERPLAVTVEADDRYEAMTAAGIQWMSAAQQRKLMRLLGMDPKDAAAYDKLRGALNDALGEVASDG